MNLRGFLAERESGGDIGNAPNRLTATSRLPKIATLCQYQNVRLRPALESMAGALLDERKVAILVVRHTSTDLG